MVWDSSDGQLEFVDNAKVSFGSGGDLLYFMMDQILLQDHGTGTLFLDCSQTEIKKFGSNHSMDLNLLVVEDFVELYYNNSNKLQTKTDGVNITGELECDTLDVDGNVDFDGGQVTFDVTSNVLQFVDDHGTKFGTGGDLQIYHSTFNRITF